MGHKYEDPTRWLESRPSLFARGKMVSSYGQKEGTVSSLPGGEEIGYVSPITYGICRVVI